MTDCKHKYAKLNERAVFCSGCGDIKVEPVPVCTLPHYPVWHPVPYVPDWTYRPWAPPFVVTSGSLTTVDYSPADVTFTLMAGTES